MTELAVSGGAGGIEAELADLVTLARSSADLAEKLAGTSATCHGMLVDPDVLASALLDPVGTARFEAALLEAGVPLRHIETGRNVAMYKTDRECRPAGSLHGPLVVSMRPVPASTWTAEAPRSM